jgi:hypothetical protein
MGVRLAKEGRRLVVRPEAVIEETEYDAVFGRSLNDLLLKDFNTSNASIRAVLDWAWRLKKRLASDMFEIESNFNSIRTKT